MKINIGTSVKSIVGFDLGDDFTDFDKVTYALIRKIAETALGPQPFTIQGWAINDDDNKLRIELLMQGLSTYDEDFGELVCVSDGKGQYIERCGVIKVITELLKEIDELTVK